MAAGTGLWHRHAGIAYLAVFLGMIGHATSEFVAVVSGIAGPEVSVWRFLIGGFGLVIVALLVPGGRDLPTPLREAFWHQQGGSAQLQNDSISECRAVLIISEIRREGFDLAPALHP